MKLVIITLAHNEPYWWDIIPVSLQLQLPLVVTPHFSSSEFPPEVILIKKMVNIGAHQIVNWTYSKFHGGKHSSPVDVKKKIERRAKPIYQTVWKKTPCMANDAIVVHQNSFPDVVVAEACLRKRYYVYGGAVDDFARAAHEGAAGNDPFIDFVRKFLGGRINLEEFRGIHPEIAHYFSYE